MLTVRFTILTWCSLFASSGTAWPSGVLIGLRDNDNAYRTVWIVAGSGAPEVVEVAEGLVVPRKSGFWRLDVKQATCGDTGQYQVDQLIIGPIESAAKATKAGSCEEIARSCASYPAAGALTLTHRLLYAGPTHFAEEFWFEDSCGVHPVGETRYSVHALDRSDRDVPIEAILGAGTTRSLATATRQVLRCSIEDYDCIDLRDHYRLVPSPGWGIARRSGQWRVVVALSPPEGSGLAVSPVVTLIRAPTKIVGRSASKNPQPSVAELPEGDRCVSPGGDMVVVRSEWLVAGNFEPLPVMTGLAAYGLKDGTAAGVPVTVATEAGEEVVTIEWALGAHVGRWDKVMRALSKGTRTGS